MTNILFATDLSARSTLAGDVAAGRARATREHLVVLHVAEKGDDIDLLEREIGRLEGAVDAELVVRIGSVIPTITAYAVEANSRYVVVGAQGLSARAVLGTVATALAAHLPMPILVVRAGERLVPFFDGKAQMRVVIPHSRDDTFIAARAALVELSRIGPIDAVVVHVPETHNPLGTEARRALERILPQSIGKLPGVDVRCIVREGAGDVGERLLGVVREVDAGLVLCGTHARRGLGRVFEGSIASILVRDACCSVLVAPHGNENGNTANNANGGK